MARQHKYETQTILIIECPYSLDVWNAIFSFPGLHPPHRFSDILVLSSSATNGKIKVICKLVFQAMVYAIWKERNIRFHSSISRSGATVIKEIQLQLRAKLYGVDQKPSSSTNQQSSSIISPFHLHHRFNLFQP
ncbi:hypothetical protein N665_0199s0058 [Sinapis alba]|nr:hypothetical protein N665_0199s0058 [Sinapis alba]